MVASYFQTFVIMISPLNIIFRVSMIITIASITLMFVLLRRLSPSSGSVP